MKTTEHGTAQEKTAQRYTVGFDAYQERVALNPVGNGAPVVIGDEDIVVVLATDHDRLLAAASPTPDLSRVRALEKQVKRMRYAASVALEAADDDDDGRVREILAALANGRDTVEK